LRKPNVQIKFDSVVSGYTLDSKNKVTEVMVNFKENIPVDTVVLCAGPQATKHLLDHFGLILPMISA